MTLIKLMLKKLPQHRSVRAARYQVVCLLTCLTASQIISAQETTDFMGIEVDHSLCPSGLDIPPRPEVDEKLEPGDSYITADTADLIEGGISHLEGNVEITRDNQQIRADSADYDQAHDTADFKGNVNFWDDSVYMHSDQGYLDFEEGTGTFQNADYRILDTLGRGFATELFLDPGNITRGKNIDYSTCEPNGSNWDLSTNIWKLSAKELTLDHEKDRGSAKHVVFRIKDIPVFYTPYITFPLSDTRKSGFLVPSYGSSNRNGFEFRTPYYWNIKPDMDATITPRLLTDSGLMLMGEFRYLFKGGHGHLNAEYLPSDTLFMDRDRHFINFEHTQKLSSRSNTYLLYNSVSDSNYFEDFGAGLTTTSKQILQRRADLSYRGKDWNIFARAQDFQIVNSNLAVTSRPYKRLPQITFNAFSPKNNNQFNYNLNSELVYFDRGDDPLLNNVNGLRFDIFPSINYLMRTTATYFQPKVGLRFTQYSLNENNSFDDKAPNRLLPFLSLDGRVVLERDISLFGNGFMQTLEPRLYYLYIPENNQSDLPVFDTGIFDFSFASLFRENRFNNRDRIADANQLTVAVTSRFINQSSGAELAHISVGQLFFLEDRQVGLPGQASQRNTLAPLVAEFSVTLFDHLSLRGDWQWDPNKNVTQKLVLQATYRPANNKLLNLAYRVRRAPSGVIRRNVVDIEQTDISFSWPLSKGWNLIGRWNYALPERRSIDMFGGIEYNSCCWGFSAVARRFLSNLDGVFQTGIFLQIELKGLAGIGRKTVDFLTQSIPGYKSDF